MKNSIYILYLLLFTNSSIKAQNILIKANYHYDSESATFKGKIEVLINRNKIVDIGNNLKFDAYKTSVIDLGEATLLPGLIDAHTHLFIEENLHEDYKGFGETVVKDAVMKSDATRTLEAAQRANSYLMEGFTSIVDLGNSGNYLDVALRDGIEKELMEGARLFVSGKGIAAQGGQVNNYHMDLNHIAEKEYQIITNVEEGKKAVQEHILMKVNLIKLYADNIPNRTSLSVNELKAVVDEAHKNGLNVTAHAITNEAIYNAAKAGVNSIEHAYTIADSTLAYLKEKDITVIPTYSNQIISDELFLRSGMADNDRRKQILERSQNRQKQTFKRFVDAEINIVFGSDFYSKVSVSRGTAAKNSFYAFLEADIPLEKALQFATYNAGVHLGYKNRLGVLKKDAVADIIAVKGSLEKDYKLLDDCTFIMKNGKIIKE